MSHLKRFLSYVNLDENLYVPRVIRHLGHYRPTLEEVVYCFHAHECENLRDRVYGLVSMVHQEERIDIDYSRDVGNVFIDTIMKLLRPNFSNHPPLMLAYGTRTNGQRLRIACNLRLAMIPSDKFSVDNVIKQFQGYTWSDSNSTLSTYTRRSRLAKIFGIELSTKNSCWLRSLIFQNSKQTESETMSKPEESLNLNKAEEVGAKPKMVLEECPPAPKVLYRNHRVVFDASV
jgi:hypothetical protein